MIAQQFDDQTGSITRSRQEIDAKADEREKWIKEAIEGMCDGYHGPG